MKKILYACLLLWSTVYSVEANIVQKMTDTNSTEKSTAVSSEPKKVTVVTRGDVKVIEATENIRYISQQMAKEYLFLYKMPYQETTKVRLKKILIALSNNLRAIAATTKDSDTKDILEFLAYSKDQIAEIFTEKPDEEQAALMLDYSETLLEGADSIAAAHTYEFTNEEHMLIVMKKMEYLLERMMKYYIALHAGFDNPTNKEQMQEAIAKFDKNMQMIEEYTYPEEMHMTEKEVMRSWEENKKFFMRSDSLFIPKLMSLSTQYLEALIVQIALYHTKNQ